MILDRISSWCSYLGISPALDAALTFLSQMDPGAMTPGPTVELDGRTLFYTVQSAVLHDAPPRFEHHRRYADIHVPLDQTEEIVLCDSADIPADDGFDSDRDIGFFTAPSVNRVRVPAGWFCVCFPQDAHAPCLTTGADKPFRKIIVKAKA